MSTSVSSFPSPLEGESVAPDARAHALGRSSQVAAERSLDAVAPGGHARIVAVVLEPEEAAWLSAVGIGTGERLTVLRRAAFGGPMHVRTRAGGEFAIARSLARAILVRSADEP